MKFSDFFWNSLTRCEIQCWVQKAGQNIASFFIQKVMKLLHFFPWNSWFFRICFENLHSSFFCNLLANLLGKFEKKNLSSKNFCSRNQIQKIYFYLCDSSVEHHPISPTTTCKRLICKRIALKPKCFLELRILFSYLF